jgi:hypothetical protein
VTIIAPPYPALKRGPNWHPLPLRTLSRQRRYQPVCLTMSDYVAKTINHDSVLEAPTNASVTRVDHFRLQIIVVNLDVTILANLGLTRRSKKNVT